MGVGVAEMEQLSTLLKRKTVPHPEPRKILLVTEPNGFEAWRALALRYQSTGTIRRLRENAELTAFQTKRCKTAAETSLIGLEVDRSKKKLSRSEASYRPMMYWSVCCGRQWTPAHAAVCQVRSPTWAA